MRIRGRRRGETAEPDVQLHLGDRSATRRRTGAARPAGSGRCGHVRRGLWSRPPMSDQRSHRARRHAPVPGGRAQPDPEHGGAGVPVLLVTATGREAEVATAAIGDLIGADSVDGLPVLGDPAARAAVAARRHRRPAPGHPAPAGPPRRAPGRLLSVVVTTIRSLIQPMAPRPGRTHAGPAARRRLGRPRRAGRERLVDAGLHPGRAGRTARRDRRPRRHPGHLPADRRASGAGRVLRRRDHRNAHLRGHRPAVDRPGRRDHRHRRAGRSC